MAEDLFFTPDMVFDPKALDILLPPQPYTAESSPIVKVQNVAPIGQEKQRRKPRERSKPAKRLRMAT